MDISINEGELSKIVGEQIENEDLYVRALAHKSVTRVSNREIRSGALKHVGSNLLNFIISKEISDKFKNEEEQYYVKMQQHAIRPKNVSKYAERIKLDQHIIATENAVDGGVLSNRKVLSDIFKTFIGAILYDKGENAARRFLAENVIKPFDVSRVRVRVKNPKSKLLEISQDVWSSQPSYNIIDRYGPSHDATFVAEVIIHGDRLGKGSGGSKQEAEEEAAEEALHYLESEL